MTCLPSAYARRIRHFIAICSTRLTGIREWFFNNQLSVCNTTQFPSRGDSLVNGKHLFEIGGEKKSFDQVKDLPDSYLAVDGIEVGRGCRIPLWLFGFLY